MGNSERAGILVPERFIPTPTTVSPQAQAFLSNPPPFEQTTMPGLDDIAGWREYVDKTNRGIVAYLAHGRACEFHARAYVNGVTNRDIGAFSGSAPATR